jgi:putative ABC transport system ATP-binding protein
LSFKSKSHEKFGLTVDNLRFLNCGPLSFTLSQGECVGVSGPSGIGKTQLFRAISDLIPSTGDIALSGRNKDSMIAPKWRSRVSMLPTDSVWWYDDVASHFSSAEARDYLETMCQKVGLPSAVVDWQVSRLSTGEKQRLSLIRSLQIQPSILLLDEPTSALDPVSTQLVGNLLLGLRNDQNLSLMWVSHDTEQLARVSDRLLIMTQSGLTEVDSTVKE